MTQVRIQGVIPRPDGTPLGAEPLALALEPPVTLALALAPEPGAEAEPELWAAATVRKVRRANLTLKIIVKIDASCQGRGGRGGEGTRNRSILRLCG